MKNKFKITVIVLSLVLSTACMKTRAQIKHEKDSDPEEGPQPKVSHQFEEIKNELVRISGKTEELEHQQRTQNNQGLRDSLGTLSNRVQELEKSQILMMQEIKDMKDNQAQAKARADEISSVKTAPKEHLSKGFALLEQNKSSEAADVFRKAVAAGLPAKEAADAYFGLGKALYQQKDYKNAIVTLSKVQETSKKSTKIPGSLLLIGKSFEKMNMKKEAQNFYQELVEQFPKSQEAKKAKVRKPSSTVENQNEESSDSP